MDQNANTNTEPQGGTPAEPAPGTEPGKDSSTPSAANPEPKAEPAAKEPDAPSAEELAAFRKWQESQKSDAEKQAAAIGKAEKARADAEAKAAAAELKMTAMSKGVPVAALDDVIMLAKAKITDKVTAEQAIDEIIKKYPAFAKTAEPGITTGVRTGGNTQPAPSAKAIDIIRAEQVHRK